MKKFIIVITDVAGYEVEANTEEEAKNLAWEQWNEREPEFNVFEKDENI